MIFANDPGKNLNSIRILTDESSLSNSISLMFYNKEQDALLEFYIVDSDEDIIAYNLNANICSQLTSGNSLPPPDISSLNLDDFSNSETIFKKFDLCTEVLDCAKYSFIKDGGASGSLKDVDYRDLLSFIERLGELVDGSTNDLVIDDLRIVIGDSITLFTNSDSKINVERPPPLPGQTNIISNYTITNTKEEFIKISVDQKSSSDSSCPQCRNIIVTGNIFSKSVTFGVLTLLIQNPGGLENLYNYSLDEKMDIYINCGTSSSPACIINASKLRSVILPLYRDYNTVDGVQFKLQKEKICIDICDEFSKIDGISYKFGGKYKLIAIIKTYDGRQNFLDYLDELCPHLAGIARGNNLKSTQDVESALMFYCKEQDCITRVSY